MQTFLDQKLEASSIENKTPPIGAPKAAAKLPNITRERLDRDKWWTFHRTESNNRNNYNNNIVIIIDLRTKRTNSAESIKKPVDVYSTRALWF
jgi:hypothetical protein